MKSREEEELCEGLGRMDINLVILSSDNGYLQSNFIELGS